MQLKVGEKKKPKNIWDKEKTNIKLVDSTPARSIITLNVNEINMPFKRQRLSLENQVCAIYKKHTLNIKTQTC